MRILYVTHLWAGLHDLVCSGQAEARGLPSFINPLKRLIEMGNDVDIVIIAQQGCTLNVGPAWLRQSKLTLVSWNLGGLGRILSPLRLFLTTLATLLSKRYDFVYCHGPIASVGNLSALLSGTPCGMRIYGTARTAIELDNSGAQEVCRRHRFLWLALCLKKRFLIITNDGSRGNVVQRSLASVPPRYEFYHLVNGVDDIPTAGPSEKESYLEQGNELQTPFLFYPARIERWKRNHLALDVLEELEREGHHDVLLLFAGQISDPRYWDEIQQEIARRHLEHRVHYLGILSRGELYQYYRSALAVLCLYEIALLSNVMLEALTAGSVVLSWEDGSLDGIVENGENGLLVKSTKEAADEIVALLSNPDRVLAIRSQARERAKRQFVSWDHRSFQELRLIYQVVGQSFSPPVG